MEGATLHWSSLATTTNPSHAQKPGQVHSLSGPHWPPVGTAILPSRRQPRARAGVGVGPGQHSCQSWARNSSNNTAALGRYVGCCCHRKLEAVAGSWEQEVPTLSIV